MSVARASILGFYKFFDPTMLASVRMATDQELPRIFGEALAAGMVLSRTTWALAPGAAPSITSDRAILNDGTLPGSVAPRKDPSQGMMSSILELAKALKVPSKIRICLRGDST